LKQQSAHDHSCGLLLTATTAWRSASPSALCRTIGIASERALDLKKPADLFTSMARVRRSTSKGGLPPPSPLRMQGLREPRERNWHKERVLTSTPPNFVYTAQPEGSAVPALKFCRARSTMPVDVCPNPAQASGSRLMSDGFDLRQSKCFVNSCSVLMTGPFCPRQPPIRQEEATLGDLLPRPPSM
jgi:hypothetical protein